MGAEGVAMRPGPKESLEEGLLSLVRDAITARRTIEFDYLSPTEQRSRHTSRRSALRQPCVPGGTNRLGERSGGANVSDARLA